MKFFSKSAAALLLACSKGYRVVEGVVVSPAGVRRKLSVRQRSPVDPGYLCFTIGLPDGAAYPVDVHKMVAFKKFGDALFKPGLQVRHLDGNSLNNVSSNIALGTPSENQMDRDPAERKRHAAKANQQHSPEFIARLKAAREAGSSYNQLAREFKIGKSTLSYYLSKTAARTSFNFPV